MDANAASLPIKQSPDRNLHHLSPRELVSEIVGEPIASDILASAFPTTLMQIIHMPEEDLSHVLGISLESARKLAAAFELHHRVTHWSAPIRSIITTPENVLAVMLPYCTHQEERLWCLALDAGKRLICDPIQITMGDVDGTEAGPRAFFRAAVKRGAVSCVAVHNHPSGDLTISNADMAVTRRLVAAGRMLDVALVDHVVISAERRSVSLRQAVPDCFR